MHVFAALQRLRDTQASVLDPQIERVRERRVSGPNTKPSSPRHRRHQSNGWCLWCGQGEGLPGKLRFFLQRDIKTILFQVFG